MSKLSLSSATFMTHTLLLLHRSQNSQRRLLRLRESSHTGDREPFVGVPVGAECYSTQSIGVGSQHQVRRPAVLAPYTHLAAVAAHGPEVPIRTHSDGEHNIEGVGEDHFVQVR